MKFLLITTEPDDLDGGFVASVEAVGACGQGETIESAVADAVSSWRAVRSIPRQDEVLRRLIDAVENGVISDIHAACSEYCAGRCNCGDRADELGAAVEAAKERLGDDWICDTCGSRREAIDIRSTPIADPTFAPGYCPNGDCRNSFNKAINP